MAKRKSSVASPSKAARKFTQSNLFNSPAFNKDLAVGKQALVDLSDDSDLEIVHENYTRMVRMSPIIPSEPAAKDLEEPVMDADLAIVPNSIARDFSADIPVGVKDEITDIVEVKKEENDSENNIESVEVGIKEESLFVSDDDMEDDCKEVASIADSVSCPICGLNLDKLTISERTVHVDDCFNFGVAGDPSFEITTQSGYVYKSMKAKDEGVNKRSAEDDSSEISEGKKPKREKNPVPELKIMDFRNANGEIVTKISMDAFCYRKHDEINHYFLSHFHSDHYMGITKGWSNGQIYCSLITKKLLVLKFKVDETRITSLNFYEPTLVPDTNVRVTLLDANHCPGSAIFLFENLLTTEKVLHCGDFRADNKMIMDRHLSGLAIDKCYLDTTYLNPIYSFPRQEHVISVVSQFCYNLVNGVYNGKKLQKRVTDFFDNTFLHKNKKNYLICVGTYTIGKERIAIDIAKKLGLKLYANLSKREILSTFEWDTLDDLITDDPFETQIHLVPMRYLNNDDLESYFKPYKSRFNNIIAFKPTGWSFISNGSIKWMKDLSKAEILSKICLNTDNDAAFHLEKIERQFKSDRVNQVYAVPYSEHSSFRELSFFCTLLDVKRIIPTVNTHNLESIREMESWISEWKKLKQENILTIDIA